MAEARAAGMDGGQTEHGSTVAVGQVLDGGIFDQREAARRLGVSVATLRRRLQDEGTGFRRLRAGAMCNYAKAHLARSRKSPMISGFPIRGRSHAPSRRGPVIRRASGAAECRCR